MKSSFRIAETTSFALTLLLSSAALSAPVCIDALNRPASRTNFSHSYPLTKKDGAAVIKETVREHATINELTPELVDAATEKVIETVDPLRLLLSEEDIQEFRRSDRDLRRAELSLQESEREKAQPSFFQRFLPEYLRSSTAEKPHSMASGPVNTLRLKARSAVRRNYEFLVKTPHMRNQVLELARSQKTPQKVTRPSVGPGGSQALLQSLANGVLNGLARGLSENDAYVLALRTMIRAMKELDSVYSDEAYPTVVVTSVIAALDSHSNYNPPDLWLRQHLSMGRVMIAGIGADVREAATGFEVGAVRDGGGALAAGVKPGDIITHIDGKFIRGMAARDVEPMILGQPDTIVALRIKRGQDNLELAVKREFKKPATREMVEHKVYPSEAGPLGVIRVERFFQGMTKEFFIRLQTLIDTEKPRGIVIDLRGNGGGDITEAVGLLSLFIKSGPLVTTRTKAEIRDSYVSVAKGPKFEGISIVVLIDEGSASASELVSAALQDYGRAIIVGTEHSFGKGTYQSHIPVGPGSALGGVRLTRGLFYTAGGRSPQLDGVRADLVISEIPEGAQLERNLTGVLKGDQVPSMMETPHPYMPNRDADIAKLKSLSEQRNAANPQHAKTKDEVLREALAVLADLISLKPPTQQ